MIRPRGVKCSVNVRPPSVGYQHGAEHGVERVQPVVLYHDLVQVGLAEAGDHASTSRPASSDSMQPEVGAAARPAGRDARSRCSSPGPVASDLEEGADRRRSCAPAVMRPLICSTRSLSASIRQKPRFVVSRKAPVGGIDVERVHVWRLLGEVDQAVGPLRLGGGLGAVLVRAAARRQQRAEAGEQQHGAPGHPAACARSHSASVVKPTITASIQYCERIASRVSR